MSYYEFKPLLCFHAQCWWQPEGRRIDCRSWPPSGAGAVPLWATIDSGDRDDGWLRCDPLPTQRYEDGSVLCTTFWFGVYRIAGQYAYDIRPAYAGSTANLWPKLEFVLDSNIDGYLGLYDAPGAPYDWFAPTAPLWQLEGLDPTTLKVGARRCNLQMYNPSGKAMRRVSDFTRSYLNTWKGIRGLLALDIQAVEIPPHPKPLA